MGPGALARAILKFKIEERSGMFGAEVVVDLCRIPNA